MAKEINILVVDDDISFVDSLADLLMEKGYNAVAVNSGKKALEKIKGQSFDVAMVDIKMPVLDGLQTFKEIKKLKSSITVIMMTAYSMDDLVHNALKEGAYDVLCKPLDIERVIKMIEISKVNGSLTMIVDDDPNIRASLKDVLEERGHVVTTAKNGKEAIAIAKERLEDIDIIDMKLPFLNGLKTFLELKKINPKLQAIIITGYKEEMQDLVEQAMIAGAYACIYKPFDPQKIVEMVEEIAMKKKKEV